MTSDFSALVNRAMKNADFQAVSNGGDDPESQKKETTVHADGEHVRTASIIIF